jgi:3-dehydroquinate dehydratase
LKIRFSTFKVGDRSIDYIVLNAVYSHEVVHLAVAPDAVALLFAEEIHVAEAEPDEAARHVAVTEPHAAEVVPDAKVPFLPMVPEVAVH